MKTARFHEVVASAGRPTLHLLWAPLEKDPTLKRADASHRVMTVHQQPRGAKKDFGEVGLAGDPKAQHLIFPKSLQAFAGRKIVGIDYDLLEPAATTRESPVRQTAEERRARKAAAKSPEEPPKPTKKSAKAARQPPALAMPQPKPPIPAMPEVKPLTLAEIQQEVSAALHDLQHKRAAGAERRLSDMLSRLKATAGSPGTSDSGNG